MNCIKCGRETTGEQVFCNDCLLEMEKYPVRPGTLVQLPKRRETSSSKKAVRKRTVPLEDQVKILKKRVTVLSVLLLICIALIVAMSYFSVSYLMEDHFKIGQNYTSISTTTESTEAATEPAE